MGSGGRRLYATTAQTPAPWADRRRAPGRAGATAAGTCLLGIGRGLPDRDCVTLAALDVDSLEQVADPSHAGVERGVLLGPGHLIDGLSDELGCDPQRSFGDLGHAEGGCRLA
jgi:hypothetical protein